LFILFISNCKSSIWSRSSNIIFSSLVKVFIYFLQVHTFLFLQKYNPISFSSLESEYSSWDVVSLSSICNNSSDSVTDSDSIFKSWDFNLSSILSSLILSFILQLFL
jgi:hypothetical protein